MEFVNLYLQTEYSLLQSTCKMQLLLNHLQNDNCTAAAITDEANMHGVIKFYKGCKEKKIKPLIGLHITFIYQESSYTILLYALNNAGYVNLMKISSRSKLLKGKLDFEYLSQNPLGILGIYPYFENNVSNTKIISILKNTYDVFYIGLSKNGCLDNDFKDTYDNFKKNNYKQVALWRVNYFEQTEFDAYLALRAIANGGERAPKIDGENNFLYLSQDELNSLYQDYEELITNTSNIAKMCEVNINFDTYLLPKYEEGLDAKSYLTELCQKGLSKRLAQNQINDFKLKKIYQNRLNNELEVIEEMGFSDYFLIVWDYVKFAKMHHIYVGPGRGSAAASLVSYSLGITDVDPIRYDLLFERFLNKERISMPDIDIDFPDNARDQVIQYVSSKYTINRVAHIVTFGTFKVRLAVRDCARVFKLSDVKLKQIIKYIPEDYHYSRKLKDIVEESGELLQMMDDYDDVREVLKIAMIIEDLPRNTSVHAAGIIITRHDLVNYTPLDESLDNIYQTQYEASDLESLGLLKMDFLGLRNLTIISNTLALVEKDQGITKIDDLIPKQMNDKETYKMLAKGDVWGVFQLESSGMRKVIMDMKTSTFEDITQAIALYRPGPMEMIPTVIKRKFKEEPVTYPHPDLEPILKGTYGIIVYQEQIILIACKFAGYSLGKADVLRKAVSKKKKEVLEQERVKFVASAIAQGYQQETAEEVYNYIVKFANYGFNKAHSVSYAKVAYQTAYLKCHYLEYYLATLMTSVIGGNDVNFYYKEGLKRNVKFIAPSINLSTDIFLIRINNDNQKEIIFPLSLILGIGGIKMNQILEARKDKIFTDFEDFIVRTREFIPNNLIENIIYSGALDEFGLTKKAMIDNYQKIIDKNQYSFLPNIIANEYTKDEFSYGVLLNLEKEMLGFNIKYNFFYQYSDIYIREHLIKINQIEEEMNQGHSYVKTLGIIKNIKVIKTKNNESMAFMTLEDDTSIIDMTLFPQVYQKSLNYKIGQIIIVKGRSQIRTNLQIVVDEITNI